MGELTSTTMRSRTRGSVTAAWWKTIASAVVVTRLFPGRGTVSPRDGDGAGGGAGSVDAPWTDNVDFYSN